MQLIMKIEKPSKNQFLPFISKLWSVRGSLDSGGDLVVLSGPRGSWEAGGDHDWHIDP